MVTESYNGNNELQNKAEIVLHQHDKYQVESASEVKDKRILIKEDAVGGGLNNYNDLPSGRTEYLNKVPTPSARIQDPVVLSNVISARHHHPISLLHQHRRIHKRGLSADRGKLLHLFSNLSLEM